MRREADDGEPHRRAAAPAPAHHAGVRVRMLRQDDGSWAHRRRRTAAVRRVLRRIYRLQLWVWIAAIGLGWGAIWLIACAVRALLAAGGLP
jgi:hypothetical protein